MTLDQWATWPEDEPGELVDGVLVEEEEVGALHATVVVFLVHALRTWLGARGRVLGSDAQLAVTGKRGRKPDLTVYLARTRLPARSVILVPPDIAIEIVSPTPKDRRRYRFEKLLECAAFGVRYYWLVDPEIRTVEILRLTEGGTYEIALSAAHGQIDVPGCEGFVLDLDALWAEIEDFDDED